MTKLNIDLADDLTIDRLREAFATSSGATPLGFNILGGEEFRRLIGQDDNLDAPVDLTDVTAAQADAVVKACLPIVVQQIVAHHEAEAAAA